MKLLRRIYLIPVYIYRYCISPFTPPSCRYTPTCSAYFVETVLKFGIIKGTISGTARILRCRAKFFGGPDPVPDVWSFLGVKREFQARRKPKNFDKEVKPN